ncbi:pumilio 23 [Wolffia australiana]
MGKSSRKSKAYDLSEVGTKKNKKRKTKALDENNDSSSREHKSKKKKNAHPGPPTMTQENHSTKSHVISRTEERSEQPVNDQADLASAPSILRKKVKPELANYFYQIANLFESNSIDLEEKPLVCGSSLEETRGEELALATDVVLSRTLQVLLEGCGFGALCGFLVSSISVFSHIATDKCGSHVAETALKSLIAHLDDPDNLSEIENILKKISEAIVLNSARVMSSPYGSHVLRSLVSICKGVTVDSLEDYHVTNRSLVLAERLNFKHSKSKGRSADPSQHGFPDVFRFLVFEMLRQAKDEISVLRVNKYSSFVLQTVLKLLHGDEEGLLPVILRILGCPEDRAWGNSQISTDVALGIAEMLEDTASCHLLEVIIEMAPESLYDEILTKVFKGSFDKISTHYCGNFAVQALLSSVKSSAQLESIWEELHPLLKQLLETGKSGVIASLLAACDRLQTRRLECCHALANAVCSGSEFPSAVIPRLLFLESFISGDDYSSWNRPSGEERMHVIGCLMLQIVFRFPKKLIQPYTRSMLAMDADLLGQVAMDAGGTRVLEAFLCSDSSVQQKTKVIGKLQGYFGELSLRASGSFVVDKCFQASDLPLKSAIASELLAVRSELSKKKHGVYLIKKLDIDGLESRSDLWSRRQANRENTYREFQAAFGSDGDKGGSIGGGFLSLSAKNSGQRRNKSDYGKTQTRKKTGSGGDGDVAGGIAASVEASIAKLEGREGHDKDQRWRGAAASSAVSSGGSRRGGRWNAGSAGSAEKTPFLRRQRQ